MNRGLKLPGGCKDLNDSVRLIGCDGRDLGVVTVFQAQRLAREREAELVCLTPNAKVPVLRMVDAAMARRFKKTG